MGLSKSVKCWIKTGASTVELVGNVFSSFVHTPEGVDGRRRGRTVSTVVGGGAGKFSRVKDEVFAVSWEVPSKKGI